MAPIHDTVDDLRKQAGISKGRIKKIGIRMFV
jgi:hypothetical protein